MLERLLNSLYVPPLLGALGHAEHWNTARLCTVHRPRTKRVGRPAARERKSGSSCGCTEGTEHVAPNMYDLTFLVARKAFGALVLSCLR